MVVIRPHDNRESSGDPQSLQDDLNEAASVCEPPRGTRWSMGIEEEKWGKCDDADDVANPVLKNGLGKTEPRHQSAGPVDCDITQRDYASGNNRHSNERRDV